MSRGGPLGDMRVLEVYNPEIAEEILTRMSEGESVRAICADPEHPEYPDRRTVTRWKVRDTDGFGKRYAAARRAGVESRIEDANEIAAERPTYIDEKGSVRVDAAGVQRNRLRCDQAKWEASHLLRGGLEPSAPLDYGDRTTLAGDPENPLHLKIDREAVIAKLIPDRADTGTA
jgi:hypothetical protein